MAKLATISYIHPATLDGFTVAKRVTYTMQAGITPSVFSVTTLPQPAILPDTGTLTITWADGTAGDLSLKFLECAVSSATITVDSGATLWNIQILDRRWKWQFGTISGHYNEREPDGTIKPSSVKTPQELAAFLFEAMGEDDVGDPYGPDFTLLPNTARPEVIWDNANPARELANLVESLGCVVALQLDGTAKIFPIETGTLLPNTSVVRRQGSMLYKIAPSDLRMVGAPIEFQARFVLQAVGLDTDDEVRPLETLSYLPLNHVTDFLSFSSLMNENERKLAARTCFRWYRINHFVGGGLALPGSAELISTPEQFRLLPGLVDQITVGSKKERKPPIVTGTWWDQDVGGQSNITGQYDGPFSIDTGRNLVAFSKQVMRYTSIGGVAKFDTATLYLECAFTAIGGDGVPIRYERTRPVAIITHVTQPKIIRREDIRQHVKQLYTAAIPGVPTVLDDDVAIADAEADYYLIAEETTYNIDNADSAVYAGIVPINVDGLIRSVTFTFGDGPASTQASSDDRTNPYVPSFVAKRNREKAAEFESKFRDFASDAAIVTQQKAGPVNPWH